MFEIITETMTDTIKLVPFLFLTYLVMEYLEHKSSARSVAMVKKAGRLGPLIGGAAGAVPQCGFSAAAANLYSGRVISMGTLIAIFLSTSDEMLPVFLSEQVSVSVILKILGMKVVIGAAAGFVIDLVFRSRDTEQHIHEICQHEHCGCQKGIFKSAVNHTLQITFFLLVISFGLNLVLFYMGEDVLKELLGNQPFLSVAVAGIIGLIPNCAASVVITQLYLEGALGLGAMMAGLLVGAGVGILILFRVNQDKKENFRIIGLLYLIGVLAGLVIEYTKIQI